MKQIEALRIRLRELQEYKEQLLAVQNKAFDLHLMDEIMQIQLVYSKIDDRIEQIQMILERHARKISQDR
jgi:uncharacterized protein YerC